MSYSTAPLDQPAQQPAQPSASGSGGPTPVCLTVWRLLSTQSSDRDMHRGSTTPLIAGTPVLSAALSTQSSDRDMPKSEILRPPWTSRLSSRLSRRLWDPEALHLLV